MRHHFPCDPPIYHPVGGINIDVKRQATQAQKLAGMGESHCVIAVTSFRTHLHHLFFCPGMIPVYKESTTMNTNTEMGMRELHADELDSVGGGGLWMPIAAFLGGYLLEKALDATPIGSAAQKLFEPIKLIQR